MKVDEIINNCLKKESNKPLIKARTFWNYCQSPFNVWADYFANEKEKDPEDSYLKILFAKGNQHEEDFIKKVYPDVEKLKFPTKIDAFKFFVNEAFKKTKAFRNPSLYYLPENSIAEPDILEISKKHSSYFGNYHYIIKEVKSSKEPKKKDIMQTMFGNYLLSKIQGYLPPKFYIINNEDKQIEFKYKDYEHEFHKILNDINEIVKGNRYPSPTNGSVDWPWESYALKLCIKTKDVSLINGLAESKKSKLKEIGIRNLTQLSNINVNKKVNGFTKESLKRLKLEASCILTKKHKFISKVALPKRKIELFLDFESSTDLNIEDFVGNIDYLIGVLKRENNKEVYIPFIADSIEDEEGMLHRFLDFLAEQEDFVIYHYGNYEITRFKELFSKYDTDDDLQRLVFSNMIDIFRLVKKSVVLPVYSYSLKSVAPYLKFNWRLKDVDAGESIALYMEYVKTNDKKLLNKILTYNEDDVIATRVVKDWLSK